LALVLVVRVAKRGGPIPLPAVCAGALALLSALSVIRSTDAQAAADSILYFGLLAGLLAAGYRLARSTRDIRAMVGTWVIAATVDAILVVYFRLYPDAEISWFHSSLASVVIPVGTLRDLFTIAPNNALSPDKAGAFFVNANAGSAFLGVAFLLAIWLWHSGPGSRRWLGLALVDASGIVASGSTTGLVLLVGMSTILILVFGIRAVPLRLGVAPLILATGVVAAYEILSGVSGGNDVTSRGILWGMAAHAIASDPILGLGFGGWNSYAQGVFGEIGSGSLYLPQNLVLYTWVEMGIVAVALLLVLFGSTLWRLLRSRRAGSGIVAAAVLWTVIHSMADNTGVFNDFHTMPVLAVLVGSYLIREVAPLPQLPQVRSGSREYPSHHVRATQQ
jgi:O-antigen ligase